jgi:hypothetical protein
MFCVLRTFLVIRVADAVGAVFVPVPVGTQTVCTAFLLVTDHLQVLEFHCSVTCST